MKKRTNSARRYYAFRQIQKKLKKNLALLIALSRVLFFLGNLIYLYLKQA